MIDKQTEEMRQLFTMNLTDLMSIYGKSQSDLSAETGISKQAISSYVTGVRYPKPEHLKKLADCFSVTPAQFYTSGVNDMKVDDLPIEIRSMVDRMLQMNTAQRGELLRYTEYVYGKK